MPNKRARHRPEFAQGEDQTYYQVMFASPDRILLEVVYVLLSPQRRHAGV
jgi:hypothetical protein